MSNNLCSTCLQDAFFQTLHATLRPRATLPGKHKPCYSQKGQAPSYSQRTWPCFLSPSKALHYCQRDFIACFCVRFLFTPVVLKQTSFLSLLKTSPPNTNQPPTPLHCSATSKLKAEEAMEALADRKRDGDVPLTHGLNSSLL